LYTIQHLKLYIKVCIKVRIVYKNQEIFKEILHTHIHICQYVLRLRKLLIGF